MIKKVVGIAIAIVFLAALVPNLDAQMIRDTVFNEDFSSTWSTTSPPAGWDIYYTGAVERDDWHRITAGGGRAELYWLYETGLDRLYTDEDIDCSDPQYEEVYLRLYHDYNYFGGGYTALIRGSSDGGSSWPHTIYDYSNTSHGPMYETFDITSWALGENDVRIDFYGNGYSYNINYWCVDNVLIYGEWEDTTTGGDSLDLEMVEIVKPWLTEDVGATFTPECKVYCNLDDVIAKVTCKIEKIGGGVTPYEDALNNFPFDKGYKTVDAFKDYALPEAGKYRVTFIVEHDDDVDNSNDDLDQTTNAILTVAVDATAILAPVDPQYNAFAPSCTFEEVAEMDATGIHLIYEITGPSFQDVITDTIVHDFAPLDSYNAVYPEITLADGSYTIRFWAEDRDTPIGEEQSMDFTYTGIVEAPVVETYTLDVVGSTVNFSVGKASDVSLRIYDASGKMVAELASGHHSAGSYSVSWDGNAASGIYFVKMITPDFSASDKLLRLY